MNKEHQLQAKFVSTFSDKYPTKRGRLFGTFQNTLSKTQGAQMLAMGLVPGVSDLIYIDKDFHLIGIEVKFPNTYHDTLHVLEQIRFLQNNCRRGWFCVSEESFEEIIAYDGMIGGLPPDLPLSWCRESIVKKIKLTGTETLDQLISHAKMYKKKHKKSIGTVRF